jgi:hypothetical protein
MIYDKAMTRPTPDYQQQFWRIAVRYLPHHILLFLAAKHTRQRLAKALDAPIRKKLGGQHLPDFSAEQINDYIATTDNTAFWHGAGRWQYRDATVVDIFSKILEAGQLSPSHDVYSMVLTGRAMHSISATTQRIIARSYADIHGRGAKEDQRYGSSLWWVAYYYNLCHLEVIAKHGLAFAKNWSTFDAASRDASGQRSWGKKVHKQAQSIWDAFGLGSDIAENYPIIFGIKPLRNTEDIPGKMGKWEVRISRPVLFTHISHLEVPADKVAEVKALLAKNDQQITVFPIELGEVLASRKSLVELLYSHTNF